MEVSKKTQQQFVDHKSKGGRVEREEGGSRGRRGAESGK